MVIEKKIEELKGGGKEVEKLTEEEKSIEFHRVLAGVSKSVKNKSAPKK